MFGVATLAMYETAGPVALIKSFGWFVGWLLTFTEKKSANNQKEFLFDWI